MGECETNVRATATLNLLDSADDYVTEKCGHDERLVEKISYCKYVIPRLLVTKIKCDISRITSCCIRVTS